MNNYRYHEPNDENPFDESIEKGVSSRLIVFTLCAVVLVVGIVAGIKACV